MLNLFDDLQNLNSFLSRQSIYPILLSTIFALGLFSARVMQSHSFAYQNLIWNLFLAWIPYLISIWAAALYFSKPGRWWVFLFPGILWLIFFPNAPYIITDFLHLADRPRIPIWYDILMLVVFAWTGCFLAIASLRTMHIMINKHIGWFMSWVFVGGVLLLGGVGIFLGRFSRWNSWDIFFSPKEILYDVTLRFINPLSNLNFYGFTAIFTIFLLVCYVMFISIRREGNFL
ncbi:MAG: DUF1361 domain-containing protein [Chloroflexota bacterium]|nr:MAG: DUF1361 domain-containing protein [Chloroflexota bacterium]